MERLDRQLEAEESSGEGHDVNENKGTCMKLREIAGNCMLLMLKGLLRRDGPGDGKKRNQKMKDEPTMLLKTKENTSDILDDPTIFMKIKDLFF